jgi:hypothetical protein
VGRYLPRELRNKLYGDVVAPRRGGLMYRGIIEEVWRRYGVETLRRIHQKKNNPLPQLSPTNTTHLSYQLLILGPVGFESAASGLKARRSSCLSYEATPPPGDRCRKAVFESLLKLKWVVVWVKCWAFPLYLGLARIPPSE